MPSNKAYFTPSTNLRDDIGNKRLLDNVIVTKQITSAIELFSNSKKTLIIQQYLLLVLMVAERAQQLSFFTTT